MDSDRKIKKKKKRHHRHKSSKDLCNRLDEFFKSYLAEHHEVDSNPKQLDSEDSGQSRKEVSVQNSGEKMRNVAAVSLSTMSKASTVSTKPKVQSIFKCEACLREYKTKAGLKNHKCHAAGTADAITNGRSNSSKASTASKKPKVQFIFKCENCSKEYKTEPGLKNHKCRGAGSANGMRNGSTNSRLNQQNQNISNKTSNPSCERVDHSIANVQDVLKTSGQHQLRIQMAFQCNNCLERFEHRRTFIHHTKKPCEKRGHFSLQSFLKHIQRDVLRR